VQDFAGALESAEADVVKNLAGGSSTDRSIKTWSWAGALMRRVDRCGTEAQVGKAQPELTVQARVNLSWRGVFDR
jgi:hypothetical protein